MATSVEQRFLDKTRRERDCLLWTASTDREGYPQFFLNRRPQRGHRVSFELFVRPLSADEDVVRTCGRRLCVESTHLRAMRRRAQARLRRRDRYANDRFAVIETRWREGMHQRALASQAAAAQAASGAFAVGINNSA